jgi:hypothetical protein
MQALPRIEWIGPLAPRALGAEQAARAAEALRTAAAPRPTARVRAILAFVLLSFLILGLHAVPGIGSLHTRTVVAAGTEAPPNGAGETEMQRMRSLMAGVVGVGVMASGASAQQAVQWRVEDGGNGHWYGKVPRNDLNWVDCRPLAESMGGYLATPTSAAETSFLVANLLAGENAAVGGYQDASAPDFHEPAGGWRWVTGEPWSYQNWHPFPLDRPEPNNWSIFGDETWLTLYSDGSWNDGPYNVWWTQAILIEWSADCNADGIVDHGQILSGELGDANGNGVPDCCDAGTSCIPCPGDITGNGVVDGVDLSLVLATWLTDGDQGKVNSDRNGDGIVNGLDLAIVLAGWGACP